MPVYEHATAPTVTNTVALELVHPDGTTLRHEVGAEPTAVTGLVITDWYDLDPDGQPVHRPDHYVLTHVPTGRYLPAVTTRGEVVERTVLHAITKRLAGLGWDDWSQWTSSEEVPDTIPEILFAVQREALAAAARGQL